MKEYTTKEIGSLGERLAAKYLFFHGHRILEHNYRAGKYEIDLISATRKNLVFTEVKTRLYENVNDAEHSAPPRIAVDLDKQSFTRSAALAYFHNHPTKKQLRMDVIEVLLLKRKAGKKPKVYAIRQIKAAY